MTTLDIGTMDNDEKQRRISYYSVADSRIEAKTEEFIDRVQTRFRTSYKKYNFHRLMKWIFSELLTFRPAKLSLGNINQVEFASLQSWSHSHFLPIVYVVVVGDAGVGKTYNMATAIERNSDLACTSSTNVGTTTMLDQLSDVSLPDAYESFIAEQTIFKAFKLNFFDKEMETRLRDLSKNAVIGSIHVEMKNDEYANTTSLRPTIEKIVRNRFLTIVVELWPVLNNTFKAMMKDFIGGAYRYRLFIDDPLSPYYQNPESMPPMVKLYHYTIKALLNGTQIPKRSDYCNVYDMISRKRRNPGQKNCHRVGAVVVDNDDDGENPFAKISVSEAQKIASIGKAVRSTEDYRRALNLLDNGTHKLPPCFVRHSRVVYEEDGRTDGPLHELRSLLTLIGIAIYNSPVELPVMYISGSATQSKPIHSPVSAIGVVCSRFMVEDPNTTFVTVAEFLRRTTNKTDCVYTEGLNIFRLSYERNIKPIDETVLPLLWHENPETEINEPTSFANNIRLYTRHAQKASFRTKKYAENTRNINLFDYIVVSDCIVDVYSPVMTADDVAKLQNTQSVLTEAQAANNRLQRWRCKLDLYSQPQVHDRVACKTRQILRVAAKQNCRKAMNVPACRDAYFKQIDMSVLQSQLTVDPVTRSITDNGMLYDVETGCLATTSEDLDDATVQEIAYDSLLNRDTNIHDNNTQYAFETDIDGSSRVVEATRRKKSAAASGEIQQYIGGKATDLFSDTEHEQRRMYALTLETYLNKTNNSGKHVVRERLDKSGFYVNNRAFGMQDESIDYMPDLDFAVSYGNITLDDSYEHDDNAGDQPKNKQQKLSKKDFETDGTFMYMVFRRQRKFKPCAVVTDNSLNTSIRFIGMSGTLNQLLTNSMFIRHINCVLTTRTKAMYMSRALDFYMYDVIYKAMDTLVTSQVEYCQLIDTFFGTYHNELEAKCSTLQNETVVKYRDAILLFTKHMEEYETQKQQLKNAISTNTATTATTTTDHEMEPRTIRAGLRKKIDDLVTTLCKQLTRICQQINDNDIEFSTQHHLEFSLDSSHLYSRFPDFRSAIVRNVQLKTCRLHTSGDIVMLDNAMDSKFMTPKLKASFAYAIRSEEKSFLALNKSARKAMDVAWNVFQQTFFDSYLRSLCCLRLQSCLVACTVSSLASNVPWYKIFQEDECHRIGVMQRSCMPTKNTPPLLVLNRLFATPYDFIDLPRPFQQADSAADSEDVIVRTSEKVYTATCDHSRTRELAEAAANVGSYLVDSAMLGCTLITFIPHEAETVSSYQGKSESGTLCLDMSNNMLSDDLVAISRGEQAENIRMCFSAQSLRKRVKRPVQQNNTTLETVINKHTVYRD